MASKLRIGVISTRLEGTDGVSLETRKWVRTLDALGHDCFFFAGDSEWPAERSMVVEEAHFAHPDILAINADLFDDDRRAVDTSRQIERIHDHLKDRLRRFVHQFEIDLLLVENALAIPMNVPLGLALTDLVAETSLPVIAHHHDFYWERARFSVSAAADYLQAAFPPTLPHFHHVVINSFAQRQLALRTGVSSTLIPNVMDFESPPPPAGEYPSDLRAQLGLGGDEYMLLQPTRIVPRKRIELAIELTRRLEMPAALVITHDSGDEGDGYREYLQEFARLLDVRVIYAADRFAWERGQTGGGQKIYSLGDAYAAADLTTYPSRLEGFGNAFLEAVYHCSPLVMSGYEIFRVDIEPKGFQVISFDDFIPERAVRDVRQVLTDPGRRAEMTAVNYEIARRFYSYRVLEHRLATLLEEIVGTK